VAALLRVGARHIDQDVLDLIEVERVRGILELDLRLVAGDGPDLLPVSHLQPDGRPGRDLSQAIEELDLEPFYAAHRVDGHGRAARLLGPELLH
jgi:hypothetical protein